MIATATKAGTAASPLPAEEVREQAGQIPLWTLADTKIERNFRFRDFREAMAFVNRVARAADELDHHPDLFLSYNRVRLTLTTHKIGALTHNDFALAARIDELVDVPEG